MNQLNKHPLEIQEAENIEAISFTTNPPVFNLEKGNEILKALNAIQAEIIEMGGIAKDRQTESNVATFKFSFRGIDDMYNVISALLVKHKVVVTPHLERGQCTKHTTKKGDITFKTHVVVRYTLFSCVDGSYLEACMFGESNDATDKSSSKALSAAQKYLYIQTFSIPTSTGNDQHEPTKAWGQKNNHKPQQTNAESVQYATLKFKNHVDEHMRKHDNRLCDVVSARGLNMEKLTHAELRNIAIEFDNFVKHQPIQAKSPNQHTQKPNA